MSATLPAVRPVTGPAVTAGLRAWTGLAVLVLPTLLVAIDSTVLSIALPAIGAALAPSATELLWIVDVYPLVLAGLLVTMGTLGDRIGRRRLLMIGSAGFGAVSALAAFAANDEKYRGIRHVRLLKTEDPSTLIRLKDRQGRLYKALIPGENWCVDVYEQCKGKRAGKWIGVPVTMFEANQPQFAEERLNRLRRNGTLDAGARKIMRLHKGDYLRLEIDGEPRVMRIVRLEVENQRLRLAEHKESGNLEERHKDPDDPFRWTFVSFDQLRKRNARRVSVDLLGRVSDPGSPQLRRAAGA